MVEPTDSKDSKEEKKEAKMNESATKSIDSFAGKTGPSNAGPSPGGQNKVQKIIMTNSKDQQMLRAMKTKLQELETVCNGLKADMANSNTKELHDKIAEITTALDKKASILDVKKMYGSLDDNNGRFEEIKKEMAGMQKEIKVLEEAEELKAQKLRIGSLESKLTTGLKAIKDIQMKLAETMTLQILPQNQQMNEEEKKEDKIQIFMDEINEKVSKIKDQMALFKIDFAKLTQGVEEKIDVKASKESLVDLESIFLKIE